MAEVIEGLRQQFEHVGAFLHADGGQIGRQDDLGFGLAGAGLSALTARLGLFLLLVRIVEEAIRFAGLGISLAAGADLADVLTTGLFAESFHGDRMAWNRRRGAV